MKRLKINFYGELLRLGKWEGKENTLSFTEDELNEQIAELTIEDKKRNTIIIIEGLLNSYQNRIEIWFAGKKIHKTRIAELSSGELLFPLFETQQHNIEINQSPSDIYHEQREVGLVACQELILDDFRPSYLSFKIISLKYQGKNISVLTGSSYNGKAIKNKGRDTVTIRNYYYRLQEQKPSVKN